MTKTTTTSANGNKVITEYRIFPPVRDFPEPHHKALSLLEWPLCLVLGHPVRDLEVVDLAPDGKNQPGSCPCGAVFRQELIPA